MNFRLLLIVLASFFLASCGFHLRNHWEIAPQYRCLQVNTTEPYSEFTRQLRRSLMENHVRLASPSESHCTTLRITKANFDNDAPTIGTINTARVFRFYLEINYQINDGPTQTIIASRFSTLNAGILTTTNNQVHLVQLGLVDDAIVQLLNRLCCPDQTINTSHHAVN